MSDHIPGQGGFLHVHFHRMTSVAGQLADVKQALAAVLVNADELDAMAAGNGGFASVDAALTCSAGWVGEVHRLTDRVGEASGHIVESLSTYQQADSAAHGLLATLATLAKLDAPTAR
jgi:hypothetical protein